MADKNNWTNLAPGVEFNGELTIPGNIRIDGTFKGTIKCGETLVVGKNGLVEAELINASEMVVEGGVVKGVIVCEKFVQLEKNSTLIGDITAKELVVNKGAVFHGNSKMLDKKGKPIAEVVAKKEASKDSEIEIEELK